MLIKTIFVVAWAVAFMSSSQLASAEQEVKTIENQAGDHDAPSSQCTW
jgi:hypothetical protein